MKKTAVLTSSMLKSASYETETRILEIEFTSGKVYPYFNFTADAWAKFIAAPSHGKHFNQFIKGKDEYMGIVPAAAPTGDQPSIH
jgi:hypothetical protein